MCPAFQRGEFFGETNAQLAASLYSVGSPLEQPLCFCQNVLTASHAAICDFFGCKSIGYLALTHTACVCALSTGGQEFPRRGYGLCHDE